MPGGGPPIAGGGKKNVLAPAFGGGKLKKLLRKTSPDMPGGGGSAGGSPGIAGTVPSCDVAVAVSFAGDLPQRIVSFLPFKTYEKKNCIKITHKFQEFQSKIKLE
jgi:hypothetical protein